MVDGQLKCLAPPQELKLHYGSNYSLLILADPDRMPEICSFINSLFPSGSQNEDIAPAREEGVGLTGQTTFQVPVRSLVQLARLLHELEAKREILGIKDYIVSQPTLQQVFHRLSQSNFSWSWYNVIIFFSCLEEVLSGSKHRKQSLYYSLGSNLTIQAWLPFGMRTSFLRFWITRIVDVPCWNIKSVNGT